MKIGILGGGLTGLALASHLDSPYEILEANEKIGGHCQSLERDGFTFDCGGPHILFSRDTEILDFMTSKLGDNIVRQRRNVKILYNDLFVKYPFENGLYALPPEERYECLHGFLCNEYKGEGTLKDWLYSTFGKGLTEKYLLPYNEKIWNVPAETLSADWTVGRVPKPSVEDMIKSAVGVETEGNLHQLYFFYPARGGIEALVRGFAKECAPATTNYRIRKVERENNQWLVSDGHETRRYDKIVSTIPVQDLIAALPDVPDAIKQNVAALRFNSLITVMLGVKTATPSPHTALYVPDPSVPFHRVSYPRNFSAACVPDGHDALLAEITTNPGDAFYDLSDEALIEKTVEGLERLHLLQRDELTFRAVHRARFAYVLRTFDHAQKLSAVLDYLNSLGIVSCGRNAEFVYINMDEAVRRGIKAAERLNAESLSFS